MDYDREHEERYLKLNGKMPVGTAICIFFVGISMGFALCHKIYTGGEKRELPGTARELPNE